MTGNRTRRDVLKAAGTAGVVALAGCTTEAGSGSDDGTKTHHDDEHDHGGVEGPKASAEVRMITTDAGDHFDPHVVWVEAGGTVTWVNESGSHTATAYAPANDRPLRVPEAAEAFDSGTLTEEGATFEHTFEEPGVYDYYCTPHESTGMIGSVIVGEPDAHGQPGLAEAQDDIPEGAHEKIQDLNETVDEALGHGHDDSTATESGHHEDDGHHEEGTESGHHEDDGHHEEGTETEHHEDDGHGTETEHHEDDGHDEGTETEHHDDGTETEHHDDGTETGHHDG